jgi:flagellar hook-basal body protein
VFLVPLFILPGVSRDRNLSSTGEFLTMRLQIGTDGRLQLRLPDDSLQEVGQLQLAQFANPSGLRGMGQNALAVTAASGPPRIGTPGRDGRGTIRAYATELSNADIGANLINMSRAELLFRANLEVLDVAHQLGQELLDMRRR